jgi:hypothetical protein
MKKCRLYCEVDYDPKKTDPEGLANMADQLMRTTLSNPGITDEYGEPELGDFYVLNGSETFLYRVATEAGDIMARAKSPKVAAQVARDVLEERGHYSRHCHVFKQIEPPSGTGHVYEPVTGASKFAFKKGKVVAE